MKITTASIHNFRGVKEALLDLRRPGATVPSTLHAILGDNGSGKTTVLQAIALTLGMATRRVHSIESFPWHGFVPQRLGTMGRTRVEMQVLLDDGEITATRELFEQWRRQFGRESAQLIVPGESASLTIKLENGRVRVTNQNGQDARSQLYGRYYVRRLSKSRPELKELFDQLGDVFWYDQYRNLGRALVTQTNGDQADADSEHVGDVPTGGLSSSSPFDFQTDMRESWTVGVEQLRRFLLDWWTYHVSANRPPGKDFISEVEKLFEQVFPGTHFRGSQPVDSSGAYPPQFYFLLERGGRVFDISEMSSGEQAVFPLVSDFVRLNIRRSVVLIDELELHLHPPEQQALLVALPKIGPDCQFIITTHSSFVEGAIPKERETRLKGDRLCL